MATLEYCMPCPLTSINPYQFIYADSVDIFIFIFTMRHQCWISCRWWWPENAKYRLEIDEYSLSVGYVFFFFYARFNWWNCICRGCMQRIYAHYWRTTEIYSIGTQISLGMCLIGLFYPAKSICFLLFIWSSTTFFFLFPSIEINISSVILPRKL